MTIPDNTVVGKSSFKKCTGLSKLVIGNNCTINEYAFSDCLRMEDVEFGVGIVFEKKAFSGTEISGDCNEEIHWSLDVEDRKLIISGNGDVPSYRLQEDTDRKSVV